MIFLDLFLGFLKVGAFSFGGAYAAIPLIREVVLSYGWLDDEMLSYMIAISESTPGPIMVNLATYIGTSQAGILGALLATFAVVLPAFIIVIIVTSVLSKIIKNKYVQATLRGINFSVAGIILATGYRIIIKNLFGDTLSDFDIQAVLITIILAVLYFGQEKIFKMRISPVMLILISAMLGIIGYA